MFSKKHISFLIMCLIFSLSLSGCRHTEDYSSSPVVPGGEDFTHSDTDSSDTSSDSVSSGEPAQSSQTSSVNPSKPSVNEKPVKPSQSSASGTASHLHAYKITQVPPTCTEEGYTLYECSCGAKKIEGKIHPKGHTWDEWKTVIESTVLSEGAKERVCTVCGEKETEQIPALTPNYSELQKQVFDLVNDERIKNSLGRLEYSSEIQADADRRAEEITENFTAKQEDKCAENIFSSAESSLTAQELFDYWMKSELYQKNILSDKFAHTAIGIVVNNGKYYWVQIFVE